MRKLLVCKGVKIRACPKKGGGYGAQRMNHQTKTALVGATAVCLALLALGILAVSAYSLHELNGQAHALAEVMAK